MFKVIALPRIGVATPADLRAADSRACASMLPRRRLGVPRTDREWTALVKIASGEIDVAPAQQARLVSLGLIADRRGVPELTLHGRATLGLPE
jgi:hypothetical protein